MAAEDTGSGDVEAEPGWSPASPTPPGTPAPMPSRRAQAAPRDGSSGHGASPSPAQVLSGCGQGATHEAAGPGGCSDALGGSRDTEEGRLAGGVRGGRLSRKGHLRGVQGQSQAQQLRGVGSPGVWTVPTRAV